MYFMHINGSGQSFFLCNKSIDWLICAQLGAITVLATYMFIALVLTTKQQPKQHKLWQPNWPVKTEPSNEMLTKTWDKLKTQTVLIMPSSLHCHRQDETVLSCPSRRCEENWREVKTVENRKFRIYWNSLVVHSVHTNDKIILSCLCRRYQLGKSELCTQLMFTSNHSSYDNLCIIIHLRLLSHCPLEQNNLILQN